jgi:hypothetical protein
MLFLNKDLSSAFVTRVQACQSFTSCGGESVDVVAPVAFL